MKKIILTLAFSLCLLISRAATVDTIVIHSNAMNQDIKCVVITPQSRAEKPARWPVVYLLHGYGGWYSNWIIRVPQLKDYADEDQLMIVCPDGEMSGWYFDSPIDSTRKYETYIGKEVPEYIDANYPTIQDRKGRAITGLSMGGHGALFIAFRHADFFGACGSMSGVVDLNAVKKRYDIMKRIGDTIAFADNWDKYSVINVVENHPKDSLAITFDCGILDPFFPLNRALHEKMLKLKIAHDYTERPGNHDWAYWRNAVEYQLLFFRKYFRN